LGIDDIMGRLSTLDGDIQIARRDGGLFDDHSESPTDFSTALMQKSLWPKGPAIEDSPRLVAARVTVPVDHSFCLR
jgi:hypothetical protein